MVNIESAQGQLQQVQLSWLPNLTGLAGYTQFPVLGNPGTTAIAYPAYIINLPLFAQDDVSKAQYKAIYIKYITTIRKALRDVANDLSAYSTSSQQLNNNLSALSDEKQQCHLAEVRYLHGIDGYLNLIKCQILLDEFKLVINQNKLEKLLSIVTLYQDLGGGYRGHCSAKDLPYLALIPDVYFSFSNYLVLPSPRKRMDFSDHMVCHV